MNPASGLWTSQAATRVRKRRPQTSGRRATRSPLRCRRPRRPPRPPRRHDRTCKTRRIRTCKCTHARSLSLSLSLLIHTPPPNSHTPPPPGSRARAITWDNVRVWSPWAASCWLLAVGLIATLRRRCPRWADQEAELQPRARGQSRLATSPQGNHCPQSQLNTHSTCLRLRYALKFINIHAL